MFNSHSISSCKFLTAADKADLRGLAAIETLSLSGQETRAAAYAAPGWDKELSDTDSENDDNLVSDE